ncbi:MAG: thioredoxin family protein [Polyangiaceae bacterium]|nr:thioredoxin family protein [Polyangiaceae bacterium]
MQTAIVVGLALMLGFSVGCSSVPKDAKTVTVSLDKIDCSDCGDEIVADLRTRPGVYDASFDKKRAEIRVVASPEMDVYTAVKQLAATEGFSAVLGEGKGKYLERPTFPDGSDAKTVVEDGRDVPDLATLAVKGKTTVVDFSAIWCRPCRKIDEHMVKVLTANTDIAYRRLDIADWDSPLAQHYLKDVPQLPYVVVYNVQGKQVDSIVGVDLERLDKAIAKAKTP